jgi:hypothetical protein
MWRKLKRELSPIDLADAAASSESCLLGCAVFHEAVDDMEANLGILIKQEAHATQLGLAQRQRQAEAELPTRRRRCGENELLASLLLDRSPHVVWRPCWLVVDGKDNVLRLQPAHPTPSVGPHCQMQRVLVAHAGRGRPASDGQ